MKTTKKKKKNQKNHAVFGTCYNTFFCVFSPWLSPTSGSHLHEIIKPQQYVIVMVGLKIKCILLKTPCPNYVIIRVSYHVRNRAYQDVSKYTDFCLF